MRIKLTIVIRFEREVIDSRDQTLAEWITVERRRKQRCEEKNGEDETAVATTDRQPLQKRAGSGSL
ncbi:hypothetical protein D8Y22_06555 [Salinadaptatus halalkaliphilus]|uniref:Uncharacterized protein n=1 Tax=Salinadaptatus halalkaliphilus TaxID=2419781 RepID=A0A4S3TPP0_9EURY|nr:hypothetical protein [Salinadaptatus halalkaliphilus]THE65660.1 hypothetical protein D8Y22_06555 [Salinadaptatus halalkaliphilus]